MRLIDAERLECLLEDKRRYGYLDADDICNSPTVEAIPVEWLKKKVKEALDERRIDDALYLKECLTKWEKENEID